MTFKCTQCPAHPCKRDLFSKWNFPCLIEVNNKCVLINVLPYMCGLVYIKTQKKATCLSSKSPVSTWVWSKCEKSTVEMKYKNMSCQNSFFKSLSWYFSTLKRKKAAKQHLILAANAWVHLMMMYSSCFNTERVLSPVLMVGSLTSFYKKCPLHRAVEKSTFESWSFWKFCNH